MSIYTMSISTKCSMLYAKLPQSLLQPKTHVFKTLLLWTPPIPQKLSLIKPISIERLPSKPLASSSSSTSVSLQPMEELPPKLQEIVKLFQAVPEPKAKYEQLLFYSKNLTPLDAQFKTSKNKVQGCVSQVWVRAYLDSDKNVLFEADSDSILTKGLAALLVQGLSGQPVQEILRVSPDFMVLLGLQQSLTPSRNNGFLNMLKLMQKKAILLYVEGENSGDSGREEPSSANPVEDRNLSSINEAGAEDLKVRAYVGAIDDIAVQLGSRGHRIKEKLERELSPVELQMEDISYQHAGHAGIGGGGGDGDGDGETHFNVKVVSKEFEGKSLVKRHRLIYDLLQEELQGGLHALSIVAKTPSEVGSS